MLRELVAEIRLAEKRPSGASRPTDAELMVRLMRVAIARNPPSLDELLAE